MVMIRQGRGRGSERDDVIFFFICSVKYKLFLFCCSLNHKIKHVNDESL